MLLTKQISIEVIEKIKTKYTAKCIHDQMDEIILFIKKTDDFSHYILHQYIQLVKPTKMGGIYIEISKSLSSLQNELRQIKNNGNTINP